MKHVLFVYVGYDYDPQTIPIQNRFRLLSRQLTGHVLAIVSQPRLKRLAMSGFELRGLHLPGWLRHAGATRDLVYFLVALAKVPYWHYFQRRYDVIVAPEPLVAGLTALVLSWITGARVVIEVNGQFESAFRMNAAKQTLSERLKERYVRAVLPFVVRRADAVKLLYQGQIQAFVDAGQLRRVFHFPNFVSTSQFSPGEAAAPPYILFLGWPWYLKGVDVLIKAFQAIAGDFPDHRLKVVGYSPDRADFERLAANHPRIELHGAAAYDQVIELMRGCTLFVLPSRTEGIARVLSEAMASQKPIIASRIGGIPAVVRDGDNGLLFESGNVGDLAGRLREVLSNPARARRLAENGHRYVREELSEEKYLMRFTAVLESACGGAAALASSENPREGVAG